MGIKIETLTFGDWFMNEAPLDSGPAQICILTCTKQFLKRITGGKKVNYLSFTDFWNKV